MSLQTIQIQDFRNLRQVELRPAAGVNVFFGENAAGKTSILEAIHVLARARTFRGGRPEQVIRMGADLFRVTGKVSDDDSGEVFLGVERSRDGIRVRAAGQELRSLSELAQYIPIQVINTESQRLLLDGPKVRRSFLNWSLFHVEHRYRELWRRYDRALRQRNAALRLQDNRLARSWEPELVETGSAVGDLRAGFVRALEQAVKPILDQWLPEVEFEIRYRAGWVAGSSLAEALAAHRAREFATGHTLSGPHRADFSVRANGAEAQHYLSRGQQKSLVVGLLLAQVELLAAGSSRSPVMLIDDLPAELDEEHRTQVLNRVENSRAQVFVTAIERGYVPVSTTDVRWFHVEHGDCREVI